MGQSLSRLDATTRIDALTDLFIFRGVPAFNRSNNGPKFIALAVQDWIGAVGAKRLTLTGIALRKWLLGELQCSLPR